MSRFADALANATKTGNGLAKITEYFTAIAKEEALVLELFHLRERLQSIVAEYLTETGSSEPVTIKIRGTLHSCKPVSQGRGATLAFRIEPLAPSAVLEIK